MMVKTDKVKATIAADPDKCDVCRGTATHWTAEIGPDALYLLTWCDTCWSVSHAHAHEVKREAWLTLQTMEESIRWIVDDPVPSCKVLEYQPGNGSRYVISFAKVPSAACEKLGCRERSWLVSLPDGVGQGSCAIFSENAGFLHHLYVMEKLRLKSEDDALVLTEIIGVFLGPEALDKEAYVERLQTE